MITHIVCFKLKESSEDMVQKARDVLMSVVGKVDQLLSFEVGVDVLHSGRSYDLVLIAKFDSMKELEAYDIHPVHQEVVKYMKTVVGASVSVDFET